VADVNATADKFHALILHFPQNVPPIPADYRDASQIDDQYPCPKRITCLFPSSAKLCNPRINNSAGEDELSLNLGIDRCDLQHLPFIRSGLGNCNANTKGDRTASA
jgi:hypothetical protein